MPSVDDEMPTTLRRSSTIRSRPAARPPPLPRPPIRSLASILEPEEERCTITPARFVVLPPDPMAFAPASTAKPKRLSRDSARWLVRSLLMMIVLVEELVLAAPAGTLHRPHDVSDAGAMLAAAIRSSAIAALER